MISKLNNELILGTALPEYRRVIMAKVSFSVDLDKKAIAFSQLSTIMHACHIIVTSLSDSDRINLIRVSFTSFEDDGSAGPDIKICYRDFAGKEASHSCDYRFFGKGDRKGIIQPEADDIANYFIDYLSTEIPNFLERSRKELEVVLSKYEK